MDNQAIIDEMMAKARAAQKELETRTQEEIDDYCFRCLKAFHDNARSMAVEAVEETGMGVAEHKVIKNEGGAMGAWWAIKGKKSRGVVEYDEEHMITKIAKPKGVIAGVIPTTNPNLTLLFNGIYALKGANTMIVSPHPRAKKSTHHVIDIFNEALKDTNAPANIFQCIEEPSIEMSGLLMSAVDTILATGGPGMVHAAYSSGTPAYGVGPGNQQTIFDDKYDDLEGAVDLTIFGCTFDNGIICADNRSFITPKSISGKIKDILLSRNALYIEDEATRDKVRDLLFPNGFGAINGEPVGKSVEWLCEQLGLECPEGCPIIVVKIDKWGADEPLSREKMVPLAVHIECEDVEQGIQIAKANLEMEGAGHSSTLMTNDSDLLIHAAEILPVCRIGQNINGQYTANAMCNVGLEPTATLGCGSWAGCSVSWNLGYKDLLNYTFVCHQWPEEKVPTPEDIWEGDRVW